MGSSLLKSDLAQRYAVLLDLARDMASTLVPDRVYPLIHAQVGRIVPTSAFTIVMEHAPGDLRTVFHSGDDPAQNRLPTVELDRLRAGDYVTREDAPRHRTVLVAPLLRDRRMLGYLAAARRRDQPFDVADAHFLLAVGRLSGVALDNARLFEQLRIRGEEAEWLETVARDLGASLDLNEVARRVAEHTHTLVRRPVVVWLREGAGIRAVAHAGGALVRSGEERALPASLSGERWADSLSSGAVLPRWDPEDAGETAPQVQALEENGRMLIPLVLGDRLVGVLAVGMPEDGGGTRTARRFLRRMAPHAASALENARLHAEVRRLSLTDPLVQLPNRRQLDLFLEKEFAAARRGRRLCFVLYDLDRFKEYNDTHGHRAGDVALTRFADVLRAETRAMNLAARYGGEEFASVLSDTDVVGGRAHAERVRKRAFDHFAGALSVSAGVAEYTPGMKSPIDLVVAADRALYRAKLDGRNRVYVAES